MKAWGDGTFGVLGIGSIATKHKPVSVLLPSGTTATGTATAIYHSLALTSTGTVLAWGNNGYGQLGNGTNTGSTVPVTVSLPSGTTATAVATGTYYDSFAVTSTGSVLAWGNNGYGQLGNGTTADSNVPVGVSLPSGTTVTAVAGGSLHTLALTSTGSVLAWGDNVYGQLGNGTNVSSAVPVPVSLPSGTVVTAIAAGNHHSLALTSTGSVLAWGYDLFGQLGNGTNASSNVPVPVSLPSGTVVTAIAGGFWHSLALTSTGSVLSWGYNFYGELGNGTNTDSNIPVSVSLPAGDTVTAVSAGAYHSLALLSTGLALAWGRNNDGQLGNNTTTDSNVPVSVVLKTTTLKAIASGGSHNLAIRA
jgi:alpha-tubulin suppressor-like RCC1 family protein